MKSHALVFSLLLASANAEAPPQKPDDAVQTLVPWLFKQDAELRRIPFSEVIAAATGKKIVPFDAKDADDRRIVAEVSKALDAVLAEMNANERIKTIRRINEVSSHFEDLIRAKLDAVPGFSCNFPLTKSGHILR